MKPLLVLVPWSCTEACPAGSEGSRPVNKVPRTIPSPPMKKMSSPGPQPRMVPAASSARRWARLRVVGALVSKTPRSTAQEGGSFDSELCLDLEALLEYADQRVLKIIGDERRVGFAIH